MQMYERLLKRILSRHDLNSPGGIDRAYEACVDYARQNLLKDPNCNAFLQLAAQKLETVPIHLDRISITTPIPLGSRLDLYVSDENEIVLSCNEEGIEYLAELLKRLKDEESNDHLHLDPGEGPLTHRSWPLVVYKEGSDWFDEQELASGAPEPPPERAGLDPALVAAVQFLDPTPIPLHLTPHRLLKARLLGPAPSSGETLQGPHGWEKPFDPGAQDRAFLFAVTTDDGREVKALLHLDDPGVLYFKRIDLQDLL
jgi:hypothetical protein